MSNSPITETDIINLFKKDETNTHVKIDETQSMVIENINNLEYFKGYAKGMNGLIEKVQANVSLENVVKEVQMLSTHYGLLTKLSDYTPEFPNKKENPYLIKGQIMGITEGVQTLRGIDISKYVENFPKQDDGYVLPLSPKERAENRAEELYNMLNAESKPAYPLLSDKENKEYTNYVESATKLTGINYDTDKLNKLCVIANTIGSYKKQNENGTLSNEQFNNLVPQQEARIKELMIYLPKLDVALNYEKDAPTIALCNNENGRRINVPELSANKLSIPVTKENTPSVDRTFKR